jgi:hypothetical protein
MGFKIGDEIIFNCNNPIFPQDLKLLRNKIGIVKAIRPTRTQDLNVRWNDEFYWYTVSKECRLARPEELS